MTLIHIMYIARTRITTLVYTLREFVLYIGILNAL